MEDSNLHILELSSYAQPEIIEDSKKEWVEYGANNDYYDWLISRYKNSTTNNSIINNVSRLIYGKGLSALDASRKPEEYAIMKGLFRPDMLRACGFNEYMLGQGVIQVIYDKTHTKILRCENVQTRLIRPEKCDEDGNINGYYYSDNWDDTKKFPPKRYSAFGTSKDEIEILVYGKQSIDLKYFSEVDYQACLPYCVLEEEIADYQVNDVQNGFSGTKVVNFNNGIPDPQEQTKIVKKTRGKLTGARGEKVIFAFNNNQDQKTTVDDIPLNNAPDHYQYLSSEAQGKILNNHNVVSPMIVGITTANSGFSSNGDEIEVATKYFYNQTVKPHQELLIDALDAILAFNGISLKLYFENLNYLDVVGEEAQPEPQQELSVKFSSWLDAFGEDENLEEWELLDAREVDYDKEAELDAEFNKIGLSKFQKIMLATGVAKPNTTSAQDREINGKYYKVRYKYVGNDSPKRDFCRQMVRASKIYRKEDIERMGQIPVNKGFGEGGADTYSIWLYKGGARCDHKWERRTYVSTTKRASIGSKNTKQISTSQGRREGYNPVNPAKVRIKQKEMP